MNTPRLILLLGCAGLILSWAASFAVGLMHEAKLVREGRSAVALHGFTGRLSYLLTMPTTDRAPGFTLDTPSRSPYAGRPAGEIRSECYLLLGLRSRLVVSSGPAGADGRGLSTVVAGGYGRKRVRHVSMPSVTVIAGEKAETTTFERGRFDCRSWEFVRDSRKYVAVMFRHPADRGDIEPLARSVLDSWSWTDRAAGGSAQHAGRVSLINPA